MSEETPTLDELLAPEPEEIQDTPQEEILDEEETDLDESPQDEIPEEEIPEEDIAEQIMLNDFAKDVDVEMEDVYELSVKLPDEMEPETISQLKDFRIANRDIDQVRLELKNREQEIETQAEAMRDVPQVSNELMIARSKVLSIQDQYNRVNWDALRQQNPAEWSAAQQDFRNQFEGAKAEEAAATNKVDKQKVQARQYQHDRLLEAMPELKDDSVRTEAWNKVSKLASRYGYSQSEIAAIEDSRLMRLLIDASKKDITVKDVQKKMVKKPPPKKSSPTPTRTKSTKTAKLARLHERARKGGKQELDAYLDAALS